MDTGPSNQTIHPGLDTSSYMDRPSMKQDSHPAFNMPTATEHYDGATKYPNKIKGLTDKEIDDNNSRRPTSNAGEELE